MTQNNIGRVRKFSLKTIFVRKKTKIFVGGLAAIMLCIAVRYCWRGDAANAGPNAVRTLAAEQPEQAPARTPMADETASSRGAPDIVASVNMCNISRKELGEDCLRHFGNEVLGSLINRQLIIQECKRQEVVVTKRDVDLEIEDMAKRFKIPVDQWLEMLHRERKITPEQYANDIVWPTVALRALAKCQLTVTRDEVVREFETQYGEAVLVRLIAIKKNDRAKAESILAKVRANPDSFGNVAKKESDDVASAAAMGLINPIRKHGSYKEIEDAVFSMKDGEISPIIEVPNQLVIIKREEPLAAAKVNFQDVAPKIKALLLDRKTRQTAQQVFNRLQDEAIKNKAVVKVWEDPEKRRQMPDVAATVYGAPITIRQLREECIDRHGREVLEGTISRKLVEIEAKRCGVQVTDADIEAEIRQAAEEGLRPKADGTPDVEGWLAMIKKRGVALDVYRHDAIWPAVVLKKIVSKEIKITEEDLRKGFESNYGEKVRCKAIVLNDQRRALEVYDMAREKNTSDDFGRLATHYSIEPGSQRLMGDVHPVRRHCGQEELERQAFALTEGDLSGVFQLGDKFVILRCEGRIKPDVNIKFADVRDLIHQNLYDKMLQRAIAAKFDSLKENATITNILAGTTHVPDQNKVMAKGETAQPLPYK